MTTKLTDWTYTENHASGSMSCAEVDGLFVRKALRDEPAATAEVVGHRHTPTGRHAVTIRRTRPTELEHDEAAHRASEMPDCAACDAAAELA